MKWHFAIRAKKVLAWLVVRLPALIVRISWRTILFLVGLLCAAWGFLYRPFPMPGEDAVLIEESRRAAVKSTACGHPTARWSSACASARTAGGPTAITPSTNPGQLAGATVPSDSSCGGHTRSGESDRTGVLGGEDSVRREKAMPTKCPICERDDAETTRQDDSVHVCCRRCGPYVLTGRVVRGLLRTTLEREPDIQLARARASHAIRSRTLDKALFEINGNNVEILSQPLPDLPKQLNNLIGYLKEQTEDAPFKTIKIEDRNALLGVVGAADEAGLKGLLKYASGNGFVSLSQDAVSLTPLAWKSPDSGKQEGPQ